MNNIIWVVGKWRGDVRNEKETSCLWELQGVFDSEELALELCEGHDNYFVGPAELNKPFPNERVGWPGCYYPSQGDAPSGISKIRGTG